VLHGLQSAELQRKVFRRTQPGEWKIVLTTNIGMCFCSPDPVHVVVYPHKSRHARCLHSGDVDHGG
jgi:HrpA-like RNA helicase